MKERSILFSAPMVRAILADRKTQTRRVMTPMREIPEALSWHEETEVGLYYAEPGYWAANIPDRFGDSKSVFTGRAHCPYGVPGDRLWVKETWTGTWHAEGLQLVYAADGSERFIESSDIPTDFVLPKAAAKSRGWASPFFMREFASRLTLEITKVRVQRLQEISLEDCLAEGLDLPGRDRMLKIAPIKRECDEAHCRAHFQSLWDSINAKRGHGWEKNDWVWALAFRRVAA